MGKKNTYYDDHEDDDEEYNDWKASYCCCHCQDCSYWDDFYGCHQGQYRDDFRSYYDYCDYGDLW